MHFIRFPIACKKCILPASRHSSGGSSSVNVTRVFSSNPKLCYFRTFGTSASSLKQSQSLLNAFGNWRNLSFSWLSCSKQSLVGLIIQTYMPCFVTIVHLRVFCWLNDFWIKNFLTVHLRSVEFWTVEFWTVEFWTVEFWTVEFWTVEFQTVKFWTVEFWTDEFWTIEF